MTAHRSGDDTASAGARPAAEPDAWRQDRGAYSVNTTSDEAAGDQVADLRGAWDLCERRLKAALTELHELKSAASPLPTGAAHQPDGEGGGTGDGTTETVTVPRELLDSLVDEDDCWLDHHGGCQAHGYLSLEPGELCPQADLKQRLTRAETPWEQS